MSITMCHSRIQKVNEDLMTINSLQKLKDTSSETLKHFTRVHHKSTSEAHDGNKCSSQGREKNSGCPRRWRPQLCLCNLADDQRANENSGINNKIERRSDNTPHSSKLQRGTTEPVQQNGFDRDRENVRNHDRELEKQLEIMTCSAKCLKDESDQRADCSTDSLEKAKNQAKMAARSRNLAMNLARQSRDQTDLVKASRDNIREQINAVKNDNNKLHCECEDLRSKLRTILENESKKYLLINI